MKEIYLLFHPKHLNIASSYVFSSIELDIKEWETIDARINIIIRINKIKFEYIAITALDWITFFDNNV